MATALCKVHAISKEYKHYNHYLKIKTNFIVHIAYQLPDMSIPAERHEIKMTWLASYFKLYGN